MFSIFTTPPNISAIGSKNSLEMDKIWYNKQFGGPIFEPIKKYIYMTDTDGDFIQSQNGEKIIERIELVPNKFQEQM